MARMGSWKMGSAVTSLMRRPPRYTHGAFFLSDSTYACPLRAGIVAVSFPLAARIKGATCRYTPRRQAAVDSGPGGQDATPEDIPARSVGPPRGGAACGRP